MRYLFPLVAIIAGTYFASPSEAQLFRRPIFRPVQSQCFGGNCQQSFQTTGTVIYSEPQTVVYESINSTVHSAPTKEETRFAKQVLEALERDLGEWGRTVARCLVKNSCGSASVCGHKGNEGSYVLTNAHVTGTRPGTQCRLRMRINGQDREFLGRVIMAAYSNNFITDWAVVLTDKKIPVKPRPLSKKKPTGNHVTVGCPRCVWPPVRQDIRTVRVESNSPLWLWNPDSISGQSGSGVWNKGTGKQEGLLTWSWGGRGAGQQTAEIYRQAREKSVKGAKRIKGLKEVSRNPDVVIEEGFFVQSNIGDLPIWGDEDEPPVQPIPDPIPGMDEDERKLFKFLKRILPRAKEKKIDIEKLMQLILLLIELFGNSKASVVAPVSCDYSVPTPIQSSFYLAC